MVNKNIHFCFGLLGFVGLLLGAEKTENPHYQTTRVAGSSIIYVDHFKMDSSEISLEAPPNWFAVYLMNGFLVQFRHRTEEGCFINIRQTLLNPVPANEDDAFKLYTTEIQKTPAISFMKDTRAPSVAVPGSFPQTYILAVSEGEAPTRICTFFIQAPYLYTIILEVKTRLIGHLRLDYTSVLRSFKIEMPAASTNISTNINTNVTTNTAPVETPLESVK